MTKEEQNKESWEEELVNKVGMWFDYNNITGRTVDVQGLKSFIKNLLSSEMQRIREKVEGMKKKEATAFTATPIKNDKVDLEDVEPYTAQGYNTAIYEVLQFLNEEK